ncbi:MAG: gliding motility-associated C-terminal domain-containing protein [Bacteroidales bacterium]|jgi:gliding motility-associated-like protein|nr:gliding motility-associated C-terminal domain-containing protein [Bacteroidales bacterium]
MKKILFIVLLVLINLTNAFSQYEFIENKGQWDKNIKFKSEIQNGAIFLEDNCITFNFLKYEHFHNKISEPRKPATAGDNPHTIDFNKPILGHAYRVKFLNSNNPSFVTNGEKIDYNNYFIGKDTTKWTSNVKKYSEIYYKDLYQDIDLKYYSFEFGLKYDIIVHPGADLDLLKMEYEGVDEIFVHRGDVLIKTSLNTVKEGKPYAYQIINNDTIVISCDYILKNNQLGFKLSKNYDKTKELIIDPTLIFSTYTGSTSDNWGFTATYDNDDNVYSGGIVFGTGYPVSTGAYQTTFAGGNPPSLSPYTWDIGIIKYNPIGTQRLFATYLGGGNSEEMPHSIVVNEQNEIIIMGTTGSSNFPTTAGAYDNTFNGGSPILYDNVISFQNGIDIFVSKLNATGTSLLGSTYIGGSGNDGLNFRNYYGNSTLVLMFGNDSLYYNYADGARGEVVVDKTGNIYVGTNTFSTNFPQGINPGYQTVSHGGQEGVVFKLNPNLTQLIWSSYLGGSNDDAIFSISLNSKDEIYVAGGTNSQNFPITPSAYNTTYNGGSVDAFVSKLNSNGNFLIGSTYFGSTAYDNAFFVRCDRNDNVFICGQTKASGSTLIHNATYSIPNSGQFIATFNSNLSVLNRSTVFGTGNGRPNISITAFEVDVCNRIYLAGHGREWAGYQYNTLGNTYYWGQTFGTVGMQITSDAIQSTTDGQDFYIMVLDETMSNLEYGTFFGEQYSNDHVDGGTSRFDKRGNVIQSVCASCGGTNNFPTSPGAWRTNNGQAGSNCNNAVFKIKIIENLATANFSPIPIGCAPYIVNFANTSQGQSFHWNFGDGTTSTLQNPSHTYTTGGQFTIQLIVNDPSSCNLSDTIERIVHVISSTSTIMQEISICAGHSTIIGPTTTYPPGTTFTWTGGTGLNNYSTQNPIANPSSTTTYRLIAHSVCNDTIFQTVTVQNPNITIVTSPDITICSGSSATISANSSNYISLWEWSSSPSFSTIISNSQTINVSPSTTTTYYVRATENTCQVTQIASVTVIVYNFNINITPNPIICLGSSINLIITNNISGALTYLWSTGGTSNSITVSPIVPTTYTITITNNTGCTTTRQIDVGVDNLTISEPQLTHNICFGQCNGTASVLAYGISPYSFHWNNGATTANIANLCAGNFILTVTDGNSCTATKNITITEPTQIQATFTNVIQPICDGVGYGSATINPTGGTPEYSYNWSYHSVNQNTNIQCLIGTNHVTITDANNCSRVFDIEMFPPSDLYSAITQNISPSCYNYCDGSVSVQAYLGTPPYSYVWENDLNESHTNFVSNLCAGTYMVTVLDAENCVFHQFVSISQPDSLYATITVMSPIKCFGETGNIEVEGHGGTTDYTYLWNDNSTNPYMNNITEGFYYVTITDSHGCTFNSSFELTQPEILDFTSTLTNMLCDNNCNGLIQTYPFGGTVPYHYNWSNQANTSGIYHLCNGNYSVIITDNNGCSLSKDFIIINLHHVPDLGVSENLSEIYEGQSVNLLAFSSETGSYLWDNPSVLNNYKIPTPIATLHSETLFEVIFVSSEGCYNTDTIRVKVKEIICKDPYIFVPNAFTPDGDGKNDTFRPYYPTTMIKESYFAVYDRWGKIIYESNNLQDEGWDGTFKGKKLTTDVYAFYLHAICINGEEYNHKGNVTLLR